MNLQEFKQQYPAYANVPDAQLAGALYQKYYASKMSRADFDAKLGLSQAPGVVEDMARGALAGVERGGIGIASLPVTMFNGVPAMVDKANDWLHKKMPGLVAPTPTGRQTIEAGSNEDLTRRLESVAGPIYEPKTMPGRFAESATEWGTGGALGPLRAMKYMVPISVAGGVTSQAAEEAGFGPWAQLTTGLATILAAGGLPALMKSAGRRVKDATKELTEADWNLALERQREAEKLGTPLMGAESADSAGLQGLASDVLASQPGATVIGKFLDKRPAQVKEAVQRELNNLGGPQLQGVTPKQATSNAREAATTAIQDAERKRTAASSPHYQAAAGQDVPAAAMAPVIARLDAAITESSGPVRAKLEQLRGELVENGQPVTRVGRLDETRKGWRDKTRLPDFAGEALDKATTAKVKPVLRDLRDQVLIPNSPEYAAGRAAYIRETPAVERLMNSDVAEIAKSRGVSGVVERLASGDARAGDVRFVASALSKAQPGAFRDLARVHIERELEQALSPTVAGEARTAGPKFAKAVAGSDLQAKRETFRAMLEGAATDAGVSPQGVWAGFQRLVQTLERQGKVPAVGSRTAPRGELAQRAGESRAAGVMETVSANPLAPLARWWRDVVRKDTFTELAEALTAPDSIEKLRKMSQAQPYDRKAQLLAAEILGVQHDPSRKVENRLPAPSDTVIPGSRGPKLKGVELPDGRIVPWEVWNAMRKSSQQVQ